MMSSIRKGCNSCPIFRWLWHVKSSLTAELLDDSSPEIELSDYQQVPSPDGESPSGLLSGESVNTEPIADLDLFFERIYNYYCEKGLWCIIIKWIFELLTLGFMIFFSGFFFLVVDWKGLSNAKCGIDAIGSGIKPCDLAKEAIHKHPLAPFTFMKGIIVGYLGIFSIFWIFCFLRFFAQLKNTLEIRHFFHNSLSVTDHEVQTTPWAAILEKLVQVQRTHPLCVVKDLSAHDVVMRIMRKENYMIGLVNRHILSFTVPWWVPGAGPAVNYKYDGRKHHLVLTKTLEWILNWCILQSMFDRNFCVRRDFLGNPSALKKRLIAVGVAMLLLSPFLVIFMLVFLFLRHAEQLYHHPSLASSRRWSNVAKWVFREFNEVDHLFRHRINNSVEHAAGYLKQFPSPIINVIAKFVSFVAGGFAAILIIIAFVEESLLEGHIFGRNLLWYAAVFGTVTAISRAVISDELLVLNPEGAMSLVVQHIHYMPKRWRGKENTYMVRKEFEMLFQYTGMLLLEEMASIFVTPYLLIFVIPESVNDILQFIQEFTVTVEGIGDVCSLSTFDFKCHGNSNYGSPFNVSHGRRSSQGKMEKSFLSFQTSYPSWRPNTHGRQFLSTLHQYYEQQILEPELPLQAYLPPQPWQTIPNMKQHNEIYNAISRDVLVSGVNIRSNCRRFQPSLTKNQIPLSYLLDWYYTSIWPPCAHKMHDICASMNKVKKPLQDSRCLLPCEEDTQQRYTDENWLFPSKEDRLLSHSDASQSHLLSHRSILQTENADHPEPSGQSHWWARSIKSTGYQGSFLEPPGFRFRGEFHYSETMSDRGEREEGIASTCRENMLLSSISIEGCEKDDLNPPFSDIIDPPLNNLFVRTSDICKVDDLLHSSL